MLALLAYLILYRPGMGLLLHAQAGIGLLFIFVLHHLMNLRWFRGLGRGRYTARRTVATLVNVLLLADVCTLIWSAVMLAGYVFPFAPFPPPTQLVHEAHRVSAWGCLVLGMVHGALHIRPLKKGKK